MMSNVTVRRVHDPPCIRHCGTGSTEYTLTIGGVQHAARAEYSSCCTGSVKVPRCARARCPCVDVGSSLTPRRRARARALQIAFKDAFTFAYDGCSFCGSALTIKVRLGTWW